MHISHEYISKLVYWCLGQTQPSGAIAAVRGTTSGNKCELVYA